MLIPLSVDMTTPQEEHIHAFPRFGKRSGENW
jgi:hypothetical protein